MSTPVPPASDPFPSQPHPPGGGSATPDGAALEPAERLSWWLALAGALTGVVLGAMMIAWPEATLKVVAALFGLWLLLHGIARIVQAITATGRAAGGRAVLGVLGTLCVVAGVVALRNTLVSLTVVVTIIGLMWLIWGILELASAFNGPGGRDRLWHLVPSGLSIGGALIVLVWPSVSLATLVYVIGAWMIIIGVIQAVITIAARRSVGAPETPVPR